MKLMNNKQAGFTLIELIIVIVILGILAVTAAPKFLDLQTDAKKSTMQGVKGAFDGATQIVYGKSVIAGNNKLADSYIDVDNDDAEDATKGDIAIKYGYPDATQAALENALDISLATDGSAEFTYEILASGANSGSFEVFPNGSVSSVATPTAGACLVRYTEATASSAAIITLVTTGC